MIAKTFFFKVVTYFSLSDFFLPLQIVYPLKDTEFQEYAEAGVLIITNVTNMTDTMKYNSIDFYLGVAVVVKFDLNKQSV